MNQESQFVLPGLGRRHPLMEDGIHAFFELLPHAAFLVDAQTQQIILANTRLVEITAYTRTELSNLNIRSLIADWQADLLHAPKSRLPRVEAAPTISGMIDKDLILRNQTSLAVELTYMSIGPGHDQFLIIVQPKLEGISALRQSPGKLWEAMQGLIHAQEEENLDVAIQKTLQAVQMLSNSDIVLIYQAQERTPLLKQTAGVGNMQLLPEALSPQEFIELRKPQIWISGKRPSTALSRAARISQITSLATAPIGKPNAMIGLAAIALQQKTIPEDLLAITELLAAALTAIFQQQILRDRVNAELAYQQRQFEISELLEEKMGEGMIVVNMNLQITSLNTTAEFLLGYPSREVIGQPLDRVLISNQSLQPALKAALMGSPTYHMDNIHLYRRDGEIFLALLRIFPAVQEQHVRSVMILFQDLSEQEQIRQQAQEFEQRAILGEVTAVFAHEVRNPINNISTGLQLMAMNFAEDDPLQNSISRMLQDCDRLAALIKTVLAFSRPTEYEMELLQLPQLIKRLLDRLQTRIVRANVHYDFQAEEVCPPVLGNIRALEQVFNNLIQNALDAMAEDGGQLGIRVHTITNEFGQDYLQVSVADTGPGVPKEVQEKIFQPFFTTKNDGTGLGLAISKRIITAHKGILSLNSFPGGTVFLVQIPVASLEE